MSIIRTSHDKENPYVILNKNSLWDPDLSLQAVGLWARIMSRPDNWETNTAELARSCKLNPQTVQKYLAELEECGYIVRSQDKNTHGNYSKVTIDVLESKLPREKIKKFCPQTKKPCTVPPCSVPPSSAPLPPNNIYINTNTEREQEPPIAPQRVAVDCEKISFDPFVKLKKTEYEELLVKRGKAALDQMIAEMNDHFSATGKKPYKDCAAALRNWFRRRDQASKAPGPFNKQSRQINRQLDRDGNDLNAALDRVF